MSARGYTVQPKLSEIEQPIVAAANLVCKRFDDEYEKLKQVAPEEASAYFLGLVPSHLSREGKIHEPKAMKYIRRPHGHVHKWSYFLPYLNGLKKAYEIGVGPGYLFRLMIDYYSTNMTGCDLDASKNIIFRELRKQLGIADRVQEHKVTAGQEIPIPAGSEAIFGFWTVFNRTWTVDDHAWFLDHCREQLVGDKKVVLLFNDVGFDDCPEIQSFYRSRAEFPLLKDERALKMAPRDKNAFCILHLR